VTQAPTRPRRGSRPEQATRAGRGRTRLAGVALLAGLALLLGLGLLPSDPVVGTDPVSLDRTQPLPPLAPGEPVEQRFTASDDDLSGVHVMFGTYGGTSRCTLDVQLVDAPSDRALARDAVDCADLPDTEFTQVLGFDPLPGSGGEEFSLVITLRAGSPDTPVALWSGTSSAPLPPAAVGAVEQAGSVLVSPRYGERSRVLGRTGLLADRLPDVGPAWAPPAVLALLLLSLPVLLAAVVLAPQRAAALVAATSLSTGLLWAAVTPPFEGADEPAHFAYAQFLAEDRALPRRDTPLAGGPLYSPQLRGAVEEVNQEAAAPGDRPDRSSGAEQRTDRLDALSPSSGGHGAAAGYPPMYYAPAALLYGAAPGGVLDRLHAARLTSVALGVVGALLALAVGRRLFPSATAPAVALALATTLHPMAAQQFGIVNNDAWVIAFGFAALLAALSLGSGRPPALWMAAGGAAVGAAMLGKPFAVALVVPVAAAWLVSVVRRRPPLRSAVLEVAAAAAGMCLTYGSWLLVRLARDLPGAAFPAREAGGPPRTPLAYLRARSSDGQLRLNWVDQFWGRFSWADVPLPSAVLDVLAVLTVLLVVAVLAWAGLVVVRLLQRRPLADPEWHVRFGLCAVAVAGIVATLELIGYAYFRTTGVNDLLQGRYALMCLPALYALPLLLAQRGRRASAVVPGLLVAGVLLLQLLGLLAMAERFYL
jgi:hypothetical protein